jgi:hypothetical protein
MLLKLLDRPGKDEDVIQVGKTEVESPQNFVHEALICLGGVAQAEGHEGKFEQAEWSGNGRLVYVVGLGGDFVVCSHQVDLGEDGTTKKLVGVIMDMTDGVAVGDGPGVERSVVAAGTPTTALGTMCRAEDQELSEWRAVLSRNMASNSVSAIANRFGANYRGRQVTGEPGIVRVWWTCYGTLRAGLRQE